MSELKKVRILEGIRQGKVGGGESYLLSLVENLDKSLYTPVVLSFTDGPMVERLNSLGIKTHIIHTETPFDIRVWSKVKKLMIEEKIDIVHAHGTRANSNLFWAAKKLGIPIIYTCHAWSFHRDQNWLVYKIRVWSEKYLTGKMDVNICGSEANKQTAKRLFKKFDAVVINNSIDAKKFNPTGVYKDIRKELGIGKDELVLASIARFTIQKQPLLLIRVFERVLRKATNVKLLMVGDGELKLKAVKLVKTLNIGEHVVMQSFRQDVPDLLAGSDVFILPSLWEAFPIALLEAMSMGTAVIGTNVDGTPEIITHNQNGLLVDVENIETELENAILELCENEEKRNYLKQQAKNSIYNRYNVDTLAKKNEEIYRQLMVPTN